MNRQILSATLAGLLACVPADPQRPQQSTTQAYEQPAQPRFHFIQKLSAKQSTPLYDSASIDLDTVPLERALDEAVERNTPDAFLIDYSGSMNDPSKRSNKTKASIVADYNFPADAEIFGFGTRMSLYAEGSSISEVVADGGTPEYNGLVELLTHTTKPYQRLLVLTDGENTEGPSTAQDVIDLAKQKGTCIIYLAIGVGNRTAREEMTRVNKETCDATHRNKFLDE